MARYVRGIPSRESLRGFFGYHEDRFERKHGSGIGGLFRLSDGKIQAGYDKLGYFRVVIPPHKGTFSLHRAVWVYHHGDIPPGMVIDHINGNPSDCRVGNLRCVPDRVNQMNRRSSRRGSSVKYIGVCRSGRKFNAFTSHKGKPVYIGCFETAEEAAVARDRAVIHRYGFQATLNCHLFGLGTELVYGY